MDRTEQLRQHGARDRTRGDPAEAEARRLMDATLGEDPFERIEELRAAGKRKAGAAGVVFRLEHERKALLARLSSEYARAHASQNMSEAKLDRLARADDRYSELLDGIAAAREEHELATSEYFALRSRLEWMRAQLAHYNAMSKLEEPA